MAHTDKDRPFWVTQNDPDLWIGDEHHCHRSYRECDIDSEVTASRKWRTCDRVLRGGDLHPRWYDKASKEYRNLGYWRPERAHVRGRLTDMVKAVRAGSDIDESLTLTDQSRNGPWYGGYWH